MSSYHPAVQLLLLTGLAIFWLIPLSSWLMLRGSGDRNAHLWFAGTAVYSSAATLFTFRASLPPLVAGPFIASFSLASVLCMAESLRREDSPAPGPLRFYLLAVLLEFVSLSALQGIGMYENEGRAAHLVAITLAEIHLLRTADRVRRRYRSLALWVVMATFAAFVLSNVARIVEFAVTGRYPDLLEFTPTASMALLVNYLSVIFYCYGYWGFCREKSRRLLAQATAQAATARENARLALEREEVAQAVLRERTEWMGRLARIGKLAQSGALSATIAHEVNQPLAAMRLNIEESRRMAAQLRAPDALLQMLERLDRDNQRASDIVRRVRQMFSQGQTGLQPLDLDELVNVIAALVDVRMRREHVQVQLSLGAPPPVAMSPGEMEHVLLNLLDNAREALGRVPRDQRRVWISTWDDPVGVFLSVADSGAGIPAHLRHHIFALSETHKDGGAGLGLWLARHIVTRHGGTLILDEAYAPGARFVVRLPRAAQSVASSESCPAQPGGSALGSNGATP